MCDLDFEQRVAAALRSPVFTRANARLAIMERVRAAPRDMRPGRRDRPVFGRRGTRHSLAGLALAAGVGSITTVSALGPFARNAGSATTSLVIGDSVASTLRDTLRLVRLMFDDDRAHRVSVVGDFNGWREDSTPLHRSPGLHRWSATLALPDGAHRYAFVVDGTRWVAERAGGRERDGEGRLYSVLHVARRTN